MCYIITSSLGGFSIITSATTRTALEKAEQHCTERGSRLTKKRRQVLSSLLESDKALSAYELVDVFRGCDEAELLPMSVYRILEFLESEGLVHRLSTANKYVACSHIVCRHDHEVPQFLICKRCHRVDEVAIPARLNATIAKAAEKVGFQLGREQLELDGLCHDCVDVTE